MKRRIDNNTITELGGIIILILEEITIILEHIIINNTITKLKEIKILIL